MPMNWDAEEDMARDVEENRELYEALADDDEDEEASGEGLGNLFG